MDRFSIFLLLIPEKWREAVKGIMNREGSQLLPRIYIGSDNCQLCFLYTQFVFFGSHGLVTWHDRGFWCDNQTAQVNSCCVFCVCCVNIL
jgi:hypothetical protein